MAKKPLIEFLNLKMISFGFIVLLMCVSCASIVKQTTQDIPITTKPDGATVTVTSTTGQVIIKDSTPCTITLKRGAGHWIPGEYIVLIEKEGYWSDKIFIKGYMNYWYVIGNVYIVIGYFIDPYTGGMWNLVPDHFDDDLQKAPDSNLTIQN